MKLVDLGVELEKETGFALCIDIAGNDLLAKCEGLAIDVGEQLSGGKS